MNVLLVEDEPRISEFVVSGLKFHGFSVESCDNGVDGLTLATSARFDAVVLDLMLPGMDGLEVLKRMRSQDVAVPVILLTARNELGDRVEGLALGADDYMSKPFFVEELAARIQAVTRRLASARQQVLQVGQVRLDRIERRVSVHGREIGLSTREFSLLEYLMRSTGQVFTRAQILEHVWGYDFDPSTNVVDVCIKRIRTKLAEVDPTGASGRLIEAVKGMGYRFNAQRSEAARGVAP